MDLSHGLSMFFAKLVVTSKSSRHVSLIKLYLACVRSVSPPVEGSQSPADSFSCSRKGTVSA